MIDPALPPETVKFTTSALRDDPFQIQGDFPVDFSRIQEAEGPARGRWALPETLGSALGRCDPKLRSLGSRISDIGILGTEAAPLLQMPLF